MPFCRRSGRPAGLSFSFSAALLASSTLIFALSGCGVGTLAPSTPISSAGPQISGRVHGGQQPVVGAHVYLFGVRGDQNGVARSLLGTTEDGALIPIEIFSNPAGSGTDAYGTYVLTAADGSFTFNGKLGEPT